MSQETIGSIDNGRSALAEFPFYRGMVGVRDRDGYIELAYFDKVSDLKLPIDGKLDGERVRVLSVKARDLHQATASLSRTGSVRVITLTVVKR